VRRWEHEVVLKAVQRRLDTDSQRCARAARRSSTSSERSRAGWGHALPDAPVEKRGDPDEPVGPSLQSKAGDGDPRHRTTPHRPPGVRARGTARAVTAPYRHTKTRSHTASVENGPSRHGRNRTFTPLPGSRAVLS
jgi:hypothetical protein